MPAKSKFGRNIPFGSKSSLTVSQRDKGGPGRGTHKTGGQMSAKERKAYVDKVQGELKMQAEKKRKKKPVPKKGPGFQPKTHNKYYK